MADIAFRTWKRYKFFINFENHHAGCSIATIENYREKYCIKKWPWSDWNCERFNMPLENSFKDEPTVRGKIMKILNSFIQYGVTILPNFSSYESNDKLSKIKEYNYINSNQNSIEGIINIVFDPVHDAPMSTEIGRIDGKQIVYSFQGSDEELKSTNKNKTFYLFNDYNNDFELSVDGINFTKKSITQLVNGYQKFMLNNDDFQLLLNSLETKIDGVTFKFTGNYAIGNSNNTIGIRATRDDNDEFIKEPILRINAGKNTFGLSPGDYTIENNFINKKICDYDVFIFYMFESTINIKTLAVNYLLHEFCHVLGFMHTHQTINNPIVWDIAKVLKKCNDDMNHAKSNWLGRVKNADFLVNSEYDVDSIMTYGIDKCDGLIKTYNGKPYNNELKTIFKLSPIDERIIRNLVITRGGQIIGGENYEIIKNLKLCCLFENICIIIIFISIILILFNL